MFAFNLSYSTKINTNSSFGINAKVSHQHLTDQGAGGAEAREFGFEVGEERFWAVFFDDPFDPTQGWDTVGVARDKAQGQLITRTARVAGNNIATS